MLDKKVMRRYLQKRKRYNYSNSSYEDVKKFTEIDKELDIEYLTKLSIMTFMVVFLMLLGIHSRTTLFIIIMLFPSYIIGIRFIKNIYTWSLYHICKRELRKELKSGVVKLKSYK